MYRYTEKDREIILRARKANKDKRAEKRLQALVQQCINNKVITRIAIDADL